MKKLLLTILSVILLITPAFAITYDYDNCDYSKAPEYSNKEYMIPTSEIDSFKYESFKNGFLGLFGPEYSYVTIHLTAKGREMLKKGTSKFKEMHILDNGVYEGGKCLDSKDIDKPITDGIIHTSWLSDGKGAMSVAVNYNKALAYGGGVIIVFGELKYPPKEAVKETEPTTHREITLEKDSTKKVVEEEKVSETKSNTTNNSVSNSGSNNSGSTIASLIKNAKCITEYPSTTSIESIDSIKFGAFPQSGTSNEPIEWIVLEKDNDKALLMSKYCIVNSPYGNNTDGEVENADGTIYTKYPWIKSNLRNYLNNEFYNTAFSDSEKNSILTNTYINAFKNDKVFIPSFDELDKYFKIFDVDWLQTSWDGVVEDTITAKDAKMELERAMGAQFKTEIKKLESIPTKKVTESSKGGGNSFIVYDTDFQCVTYISKTYVGTSDGGMQNFIHEGTTRPLIWVSLNGAVNNNIEETTKEESKNTGVSNVQTNANIGSVITFGSYLQQRNSDEKQPIEWIIWDADENSILLLSKYGLSCSTYHGVNYMGETTNWENCHTRKWLNNDFYKKAFNEDEKKQILETLVKNESFELDYFSNYSSSIQGPDTYDKVFLLSVKDLLSSEHEKDMATVPTERAKIDRWQDCWWTRTRVNTSNEQAIVYGDGKISVYNDNPRELIGTSVAFPNVMIRPAIRISIK